MLIPCKPYPRTHLPNSTYQSSLGAIQAVNANVPSGTAVTPISQPSLVAPQQEEPNAILSAAHSASSIGRMVAVGYKGYKEYGFIGLVGLEIAYGLGSLLASLGGAMVGGANCAAVGAILFDAYGIYKGYETYKGR